jgi:hypothetical protein
MLTHTINEGKVKPNTVIVLVYNNDKTTKKTMNKEL